MGMTIAEKIIALAAGVPEVKAGDIHTVTLDRMMSNDGTTHLTVDMYNNKLKHPHIADAKKMVFIVDHNVPADSPKTAASAPSRFLFYFSVSHQIYASQIFPFSNCFSSSS